MSTIVMGIDVTEVPTADLMEMAAKLLELDADTIDKIRGLAAMLRVEAKTDFGVSTNRELATALRSRAASVRNLETQ